MRFYYEALNSSGYEKTGVIEGRSKADAIDQIRSMGLFPTRVLDYGDDDRKDKKVYTPHDNEVAQQKQEEKKVISEQDKKAAKKLVRWFLAISIFTVALSMWGCPMYNVWRQSLIGKAELSRAEYNRKIKAVEAEASMEAAASLAEAEIIRAQGVAKANKIIGDSLDGNESYLRYLWIQGLQTNDAQVVYIPTEAGLPILEANRLGKNGNSSNKGGN